MITNTLKQNYPGSRAR